MPDTSRMERVMSGGQSRAARKAGTAAGTDQQVLHVMRMKGVAGSEGHLLELVSELARVGWRSHALLPGPQPSTLKSYGRRLAEAGGGRVSLLRMGSDLSPSLLAAIARRLRVHPPAVLHTHLVHADWYGALAAASAPSVALVSSKHNHDPFRTGRLYGLGERIASRRSDATIAISSSLAEFTNRHGGSRAFVVPYGLRAPDVPPTRNGGDGRTLLAVARLEEQKGIDVLLEAFAVVAGEAGDCRLLVAGDGGDRQRLERRSQRLGLESRVRFLGWRTDVGRLMDEADVLVHPARWEGFGLVLLEAMRAGLPVVATDVGAIPEVVKDGETGILVPPENPAAFAAATLTLVRDPCLCHRLGQAAFARLKAEFSSARMARRTVAVYEEALVGRRSTHVA